MVEFNRVIKLHLELPVEEVVLETLQKYGKVKDGITRDVLVPETMSLYQLHYIIQKAFGWRNSHLHRFSLPPKTFDAITKDSFIRWGRFCGVLFRFMGDDFEDTYWWDDYDGKEDPETWMRSKYRTPFMICRGCGEQFMEAQHEYRTFLAQNPEVRKPVTFEEYRKRKEKGGNGKVEFLKTKDATVQQMNLVLADCGALDELLERLTVGELLTAKPDVREDRLEELAQTAESMYDAHLAVFAKKWAKKSRKTKRRNTDYYLEMREWNPAAFPLTDELLYDYDYGDGWEIRIRLTGEYARTDGDLPEDVLEVFRKRRPLCVDADGLPVMDDAGGIGGYAALLETIYGPDSDYESRVDARYWAHDMGWTGKLKKPRNIL